MPHACRLPSVHFDQVIAVGPGGRKSDGTLIPVSVKVGDTVLLPEYGGHTVKVGEEELQLFRDEDILGRFES
jgi:chaperonin GroES